MVVWLFGLRFLVCIIRLRKLRWFRMVLGKRVFCICLVRVCVIFWSLECWIFRIIYLFWRVLRFWLRLCLVGLSFLSWVLVIFFLVLRVVCFWVSFLFRVRIGILRFCVCSIMILLLLVLRVLLRLWRRFFLCLRRLSLMVISLLRMMSWLFFCRSCWRSVRRSLVVILLLRMIGVLIVWVILRSWILMRRKKRRKRKRRLRSGLRSLLRRLRRFRRS